MEMTAVAERLPSAPQATGKLLHLELLRMIAIFMVLLNHTGLKGNCLFIAEHGSPLYGLYLFVSIAIRVTVPTFYMVSGALLLGKRESIRELYSKRVLRFVLALVLTSAYYYVFFFRADPDFGFADFFKRLYSSNMSIALWYLYSFLGLLLMLPLLRKLALAMDAREYVYLALCYITLTGVTPALRFLLAGDTLAPNYDFSAPLLTSTGMFFFLMGYFLERVLDRRFYTGRNVALALVVGAVTVALNCLLTNYSIELSGSYDDSAALRFHDAFNAVPAMALFFACKYLFQKLTVSPRTARLLCFFGGTSFGVFLMEQRLRERTEFVCDFLSPYIGKLPAALVWVACACVVGSLITALLKKLPGVRKLL